MDKQLVYLDPRVLKKSDRGVLRSVNKEEPNYQFVKESVRKEGMHEPIQVYQKENGDYVILSGHNRQAIAIDLGWETVPCIIKDVENEDEELYLQTTFNLQRIPVAPAAYGRMLNRMLEENPKLTEPQLASKLNVGVQFIKDRLQLNKLPQEAQDRVDKGEILLQNAKALSTLPVDEIPNWVDRAATQKPAEFIEAVKARGKELKDTRKPGKEVVDSEEVEEFEPPMYLKKRSEVAEELKHHNVRRDYFRRFPQSTKEEAFDYAIAWVLNQDPDSIERARQKHEQRLREKQEAEQRRKQQWSVSNE